MSNAETAATIPCGDCDRVFTTVQARGRHRAAVHGAPTQRNPNPPVEHPGYACPECSTSFNRPQSLGVHRRIRHGVLGTAPSNVARRATLGQSPLEPKPRKERKARNLSLVPEPTAAVPPALDEQLTVVMVARSDGALQLGLKGKTGTWLATVVGQAPD